MSDQRAHYAKKFPKKARLAVDGLGGREQSGYAVMMLLVEEGSLRFNEICDHLDMHSQSVNNTLDDLQRGGLIKKEVGDKIGDQSTGQYTITNFGDRVLDSLYQAADPEADIGTHKTLKEAIADSPQESLQRVAAELDDPGIELYSTILEADSAGGSLLNQVARRSGQYEEEDGNDPLQMRDHSTRDLIDVNQDGQTSIEEDKPPAHQAPVEQTATVQGKPISGETPITRTRQEESA
ncbi:MarR family transcriptional regulator [Salinirussus salinus]|uniref:MarR family transcriptional regulator n=1 Tax=Salinirussus salinus TaxID=1198300 RepID=UPI00135A8E3D|nr:MarR family transcriptional regulator [Salinirussus salinus]